MLDTLLENDIYNNKLNIKNVEYAQISINEQLSKQYKTLLKNNIVYFKHTDIMVLKNCQLRKLDQIVLQKYNLDYHIFNF